MTVLLFVILAFPLALVSSSKTQKKWRTTPPSTGPPGLPVIGNCTRWITQPLIATYGNSLNNTDPSCPCASASSHHSGFFRQNSKGGHENT
ncbi:hypothetical protein CK203_064574 [Vitis vinifera]|uniref:Uncharacterized protein n=1 Tax=Vitis vinifera TaxID=29760 RepID=A0A438G772_VITVI|nr:hypothetical protein CK203_064574 [Vitis vinifera]